MPAAEEVRAHLPAVLRSLEGLRYQLLGLLASLPPAPAEEAETGADPPAGTVAELRSALECAAYDHCKPLIEALAGTLRDGPREPG